MKANYCPNYTNCKLATTNEVVKDKLKEKFISDYCMKDKNHWSKCKRYITKTTLNFCPDFVLPDTFLTPEEIIDKFDNEIF